MDIENEIYTSEEDLSSLDSLDPIKNYTESKQTQTVLENINVSSIKHATNNILVMNKTLENFKERHSRIVSVKYKPVYRKSIQNNFFQTKKKKSYLKKIKNFFKSTNN